MGTQRPATAEWSLHRAEPLVGFFQSWGDFALIWTELDQYWAKFDQHRRHLSECCGSRSILFPISIDIPWQVADVCGGLERRSGDRLATAGEVDGSAGRPFRDLRSANIRCVVTSCLVPDFGPASLADVPEQIRLLCPAGDLRVPGIFSCGRWRMEDAF